MLLSQPVRVQAPSPALYARYVPDPGPRSVPGRRARLIHRTVELDEFRQELAEHYARAQVHALVSFRETPGLVSLEAAALGCAVVSTDRGSAGPRAKRRGAAFEEQGGADILPQRPTRGQETAALREGEGEQQPCLQGRYGERCGDMWGDTRRGGEAARLARARRRRGRRDACGAVALRGGGRSAAAVETRSSRPKSPLTEDRVTHLQAYRLFPLSLV